MSDWSRSAGDLNKRQSPRSVAEEDLLCVLLVLAPEEETADDDGNDDEGAEDTTDDGPGGRSWSELPLLFWRDGEKTDSFSQHQKRSNAEALCYDGEAEERSDTRRHGDVLYGVGSHS